MVSLFWGATSFGEFFHENHEMALWNSVGVSVSSFWPQLYCATPSPGVERCAQVCSTEGRVSICRCNEPEVRTGSQTSNQGGYIGFGMETAAWADHAWRTPR